MRPSPLALAGARALGGSSSALPVATLPLVLQKICAQVQKRQTRVGEFVRDFDKLRTGMLSRESFVRALGLAGLSFTAAEAKVLLAEFAAPSDSSQVMYTAFVAALDDFVRTQPASAAEPTAVLAQLSAAAEAEVAALLPRLSYVVRTRGIIVKDFLGDFDTLNTGYVTESQFRREFNHCFPINCPEHEIDLMVAKFAQVGIDGSPRRGGIRTVNYRMLAQLTGGPPPANLVRSGVVPQRPTESSIPTKIADTEARLAARARQRRLAVDALFEKQSLGRGTTSRRDFVSVLAGWGAGGVTGKAIQDLADFYAAPGAQTIPYGALLATIRASASVAGVAATRLNNIGRDAPALDALLKTTCAYMLRHGLDAEMLAEKFRGFDSNKESHTSSTQFERVLRSYELTPTKSADLQLLKRRYVNTASGRINYAAFVAEVAAYEAAAAASEAVEAAPSPVRVAARARAAAGTALGFSMNASAPVPPTLTAVMRKIRTVTKQSGVRLRQFFEDADPLRRGLITVNQFESGVDSAGYGLKPSALSLLSSSYGDAIETDPSGRPLVRWSTMCDDVDSIFTLRGLESNPTLDVDGGIAALMAEMEGKTPRLSPAEEGTLATLLASLAVHIAKRRIQLMPTFEGFDKLKRGCVTATQFERCLSIAELHAMFTRDQLAVVKRAFASEPATPGVQQALLSTSLLSYRWFLFALQDPSLVTRLPPMDEPMSVPPGAAAVTQNHSPKNRRAGRRASAGRDSLASVVDKICVYCAHRSIRLSEFFPDYDELRRGCMPKAKMRTALAAAGLDLDELEIQCIETAYAHPEALFADMVCYPQLMAAVDARLRIVKSARRAEPPAPALKPTVAAAIAQIRAHVAERSIDVTPVFVSRDRNRTGVVTLSKFMGGLDFLGVFELPNLTRSGPQVAALLAEFKAPDRADFKSNASNYALEYARFCELVLQ